MSKKKSICPKNAKRAIVSEYLSSVYYFGSCFTCLQGDA